MSFPVLENHIITPAKPELTMRLRALLALGTVDKKKSALRSQLQQCINPDVIIRDQQIFPYVEILAVSSHTNVITNS